MRAWLWSFRLLRRSSNRSQSHGLEEDQSLILLTRLIEALPSRETKLKVALEQIKGVIKTQQKARIKAEQRLEKLRGLMLQFLDRHSQIESSNRQGLSRSFIVSIIVLGCAIGLNVYFILTVSDPWAPAWALWQTASDRVSSGLIPSQAGLSSQRAEPAEPSNPIVMIHVVEMGDTPMRIAQRFAISADDLIAVNAALRGIPLNAPLRPGVLLNIPDKIRKN